MTSQDYQRSLTHTIREATKTLPVSEVIFHLQLQQSLLNDAVKYQMAQATRQEQACGIVGPNGVKLPPGRQEPPADSTEQG